MKSDETTTAVTAESVTAAAPERASQKIAAKSIAEASTQETTERSSWIKVITGAEATDGVTVTGDAAPGSKVQVQLGATTLPRTPERQSSK